MPREARAHRWHVRLHPERYARPHTGPGVHQVHTQDLRQVQLRYQGGLLQVTAHRVREAHHRAARTTSLTGTLQVHTRDSLTIQRTAVHPAVRHSEVQAVPLTEVPAHHSAEAAATAEEVPAILLAAVWAAPEERADVDSFNLLS